VRLVWSKDLSFCPRGNYGWNATDALMARIAVAARPGDHVLVMSNCGFGGIHDKLLQALTGAS